jgi:Na+-transporting NADH:ubiquinone oxidoreductase subunit D
MGRCEAYGNSNPPGVAFIDGFFNALGYTFILLIIATFREILGMGTFLGYAVPYFSSQYWDKWIIMVMPPGAFFMLAIVTWVFRSIQLSGQENKK